MKPCWLWRCRYFCLWRQHLKWQLCTGYNIHFRILDGHVEVWDTENVSTQSGPDISYLMFRNTGSGCDIFLLLKFTFERSTFLYSKLVPSKSSCNTLHFWHFLTNCMLLSYFPIDMVDTHWPWLATFVKDPICSLSAHEASKPSLLSLLHDHYQYHSSYY